MGTDRNHITYHHIPGNSQPNVNTLFSLPANLSYLKIE